MERRSEDIVADPTLRENFLGQESFDEWVGGLTELSPDDISNLDELRSDPRFAQAWQRSLSPWTNISEVYYLLGHTERAQRSKAIAEVLGELPLIDVDWRRRLPIE